MRRVQRERRPIGVDGLFDPPESQERVPEIVAREGARRLELDRAPVELDRLPMTAFGCGREAEVVQSRRIGRIERQRREILPTSIVDLSSHVSGDAAVVMERRLLDPCRLVIAIRRHERPPSYFGSNSFTARL
ncbi:MAG TPA: hypothetical protein VFD92_22615 [Candidatus Binatia bacterium]|nr:hypothetical protein [Candidatus Binatia bacterium]